MAAEYDQNQSGLRSELEEPRRTHGNGVNAGGFDEQNQVGVGAQDQTNTGADFAPQDQQATRDFGREDQAAESGYGGGYGGVSEEVPPQHKLHSDDEPLPTPTPGTYDDNLPATQPRDAENFGSADQPAGEQVIPHPSVGGEDYSDAPQRTQDYQESRDSQPTQNFDDAPVQTQQGTGVTDEGVNEGGYSDPSAAFPGAPVDRKLDQPGYGYDGQNTSGTPNETFLGGSGQPTDTTAPTATPHEPVNTTLGTGAPKKESLIAKIKDKLPGHNKSADTAEYDNTVDDTTAGAPPKKGLITKLKEKLPGHHTSD